MENSLFLKRINPLIKLLRWDKPSGRLILLIPAGWSLWMTPVAPPSIKLVALIVAGGLFTSGAGCIANDLWDKNIDKQVLRTRSRPLASGAIASKTAWLLLSLMLILSLIVLLLLPSTSQGLCFSLAILSLVPIFIYPSAKRWFKFPQFILAFCWGFAVLIPWAASESSLLGGFPLWSCWLATIAWTFGFDTVYAMSDQVDDKRLGLNSSVLSLGRKANIIVSFSYGITSILLASGAVFAEVNFMFWPIWFIASLGMQREALLIRDIKASTTRFGRHFSNQVKLGGLILVGLIVGRLF